MKDHTGKKYNQWTVLEFSHKDNDNYYWKCRCDCGNVNNVSITNLTFGGSKRCRECFLNSGILRKDYTGQKYNLLKAIKFVEIKNKTSHWLFKCDCGNEKVICASNVVGGKQKSCGCLSEARKITEEEKQRREAEKLKLQAKREEKTESTWRVRRLKTLSRDNWKCQNCGEFGNEVHHKDGTGSNRSVKEQNNELDNLITYCHKCHMQEERRINPKLNQRIKLTPEESKERKIKIFNLRKSGMSNSQIARTLGITRQRISQIIRKELSTR